MPKFVRLLPDEVTRLCAHETFLGGMPPSSSMSSSTATVGAFGEGGRAEWWREDELVEAWSTRLPSMPSGYEPRIALLRGIAICETTARTTTGGEKGENDNEDDDGEDDDAMEDARDAIGRGKSGMGGLERRWRYFPEAGLPSDVAVRIGSMFALRDAWTAEEATPYLERFVGVAPSSDGEGGIDD